MKAAHATMRRIRSDCDGLRTVQAASEQTVLSPIEQALASAASSAQLNGAARLRGIMQQLYIG